MIIPDSPAMGGRPRVAKIDPITVTLSAVRGMKFFVSSVAMCFLNAVFREDTFSSEGSVQTLGLYVRFQKAIQLLRKATPRCK